MSNPKKPKFGYVGLVYGRPHKEKLTDTYGDTEGAVIQVFMKRSDATKRYEAVRQICLTASETGGNANAK